MSNNFLRILAQTLLATGLLPAAYGTAAAMEKCVSANGKITYSEQACPPGSTSAPIRRSVPAAVVAPPPVASPSAGNGIDVIYYDVQGVDPAALQASLGARGGFHGETKSDLTFRYQTLAVAGGCKVDSLATTLVLKMTLPRWNAPPGASADLRKRWERYIAALRLHEDGHADNARWFEKTLKAELGPMTAPDCATLDAAVRARHTHMQQEYRQRDTDYDKRTGHGKTQGAEFRAAD